MSKSRKGGKAFQIKVSELFASVFFSCKPKGGRLKRVYPLVAGKMFEDIFTLTD